MANYYISPTGNDSSGDGSVNLPWRTIAKLNAVLTAGDTGIIEAGQYSDSINPANNGILNSPIRYRGATDGVDLYSPASTRSVGRINFSGKSHIIIERMNFLSTGATFININDTCHYITVQDCGFSSSDNGGSFSFYGVRIYGSHNKFINNIVGPWHGGDFFQLHGNSCLIEGNNATFGDNPHGTFHVYGGNNVVQNNYCRNIWSRAGEITDSKQSSNPSRNLIQNNIFFDNGWDAVNPNSGTFDSDGAGDGQLYKLGMSGTIMRNNLWVANNIAHDEAHTYPFSAVVATSPYGTAEYWQNMRVYHNTFYDSQLNAWAITRGSGEASLAPFMTDNKWFNNIFHNSGLHDFVDPKLSFYIASTVEEWADTYEFRNNILTEPIRRNNQTYTASQYNSAFSSIASGNISTAPTYVSPNYSAAMSNRNILINRSNYALQSGSAGKSAGKEITKVAVNSSGTTLTVEDAWVISDGNDIITGDILLINGQETTVVNWVNETTVTISPAITVIAGQNVYLAEYGGTPDMGIILSASAPPPTPDPEEPVESQLSEPIVVASAFDTVAVSSLETSAFTPSPNSLLLVFVAYSIFGNSDVPLVDDIVSTISDIGTFTLRLQEIRYAGTDTILAVFSTEVGEAPTEGTILVSAGGDPPNEWRVVVVEYTGHKTGFPIVQHKSGSSSSTAPILTLNATPTYGNDVIAVAMSRGLSTPIVADSDYTEIFNEPTVIGAAGFYLQLQHNIAETNLDISWSGLHNAGNVYAALEIAQTDVAPEISEPVEWSTPILLNTVQSSSSITGIASGTITPTANALLVLTVSGVPDVNGIVPTPISVSYTFTETLTWSKHELSTGTGATAIFYAIVGESPNAGIINISFANSTDNVVVNVIEISEGVDIDAPFVQFVSGNYNTVAPHVHTFPALPSADSLVIGVMGSRGTGIILNPDPLYTELTELTVSNHTQEVQYKVNDAAQTIQWGGTMGGNNNIAIAIEFARGEITTAPPPEEVIEISNPVLINVTDTESPVTTLTSASFTPTPNSLLLVSISGNAEITSNILTPMTISSTFAGAIVWEKYESSSSSISAALFYAVLGDTPGTGTITVDFANLGDNVVMNVFEIEENFDTDITVVQATSGVIFHDPSFAISFPGTPNADSLIFATIGSRGTDTVIVPGTGYTELTDGFVSTNHHHQDQYAKGDTDGLVEWTGKMGSNGSVGIAIEIAVLSSETDIPTGPPPTPPKSGKRVKIIKPKFGIGINTGF